jgi:alpha-1,2-glucosyltransferase
MLYIWPCIVFFSWPALLPSIARLSRKTLPRVPVALAAMGLMLLAVHLNTVIHPFTLADNRHYVFYVFRILLRHAVIKYAAIPVYFTCAWLVIDAMGGMPTGNESKVRQKTKRDKGHDQTPPTRPMPEDSTRVSFVLVWLFATTLSLVTAPLVEPRYFIIPWLVWRMNIPVESPWEDSRDESEARNKRAVYQTLCVSVQGV